MAKPRKLKKAAASVLVPRSHDELSAYLGEIGAHERELQHIHAEMNAELASTKEGWERRAAEHTARIEALSNGVQIWCEAHRSELTNDGKTKTAVLPTGEVAWRTRPPSVRVTGQEVVLDALRRSGLSRFIRVKEEVNKEAILNEPAAVHSVPGISILQGEDFIITPFEIELAKGV